MANTIKGISLLSITVVAGLMSLHANADTMTHRSQKSNRAKRKIKGLVIVKHALKRPIQKHHPRKLVKSRVHRVRQIAPQHPAIVQKSKWLDWRQGWTCVKALFSYPFNYKDTAGLMYWDIHNHTGSALRVVSDHTAITLRLDETRRLYRKASFVIQVKNRKIDEITKIETVNHNVIIN